MFKVGDFVAHKKEKRLDNGVIKWVSKTGKKVTVTWGLVETVFGYEGTNYFASSLEHKHR